MNNIDCFIISKTLQKSLLLEFRKKYYIWIHDPMKADFKRAPLCLVWRFCFYVEFRLYLEAYLELSPNIYEGVFTEMVNE